MIGIAYLFDLPSRNGWRFHSYIFVTYCVTTALWAIFMVVYIMKRPNDETD